MHRQITALLVLLVSLAGCATVSDGNQQTLSVVTQSEGKPLPGARCSLTNTHGETRLTTPARVSVHHDYADLKIQCRKPGYAPKEAEARSQVNAKILGNILFGGAVGLGLDHISGSAYTYPTIITVDLGGPLPGFESAVNPAQRSVNSHVSAVQSSAPDDELRTLQLVRRTACEPSRLPALLQHDQGVSHYITHCQDGRTARTVCQESACRFKARDD